jgi:excisionase family DNA binding protein
MDSIYSQSVLPVPYCAGFRRLPLRVNNVARRLQKPERTVRHLASTGRIRAHKIDGKSWGFWPEDVEAYQLSEEARDAERW